MTFVFLHFAERCYDFRNEANSLASHAAKAWQNRDERCRPARLSCEQFTSAPQSN
jgi:hypothetical protein